MAAMQTTREKLAGNRMREQIDVVLAVATPLAGLFGYYKLSGLLQSVFSGELPDHIDWSRPAPQRLKILPNAVRG